MNIRRGTARDITQCGGLLRSLPEWFGIESSIVEYEQSLQHDPFWVSGDESISGFVAANVRFPHTAEITVMAVARDLHRTGLGRRLVGACEEELVLQNVEYLQVKTLSPSREDSSYAKTRKFYESLGFRPLEEFPTLWDPGNPALQYIKALHR